MTEAFPAADDPAPAAPSPHGSYSTPTGALAALEARLENEHIEINEDSGDVLVPSEAAPEVAPGPSAVDRFRCEPCGDVEPLKHGSSPVMPSAAEVEEHRTSGHIPYRSWCSECAMGRGLGEQRGRHEGRPHAIPVIGMDYWYITET